MHRLQGTCLGTCPTYGHKVLCVTAGKCDGRYFAGHSLLPAHAIS